MATKIQLRRGSASQWTTANPTLSLGEFGYESDTGRAKIGDGVTDWNTLTYFRPALDDEFNDLDEKETNDDDDFVLIYDSPEDIYYKTTRKTFLMYDNIKKISTIAIAKTLTDFTDNEIIHVPETNTFYKYIASGSAYTANDKNVLITGNGGNTRWVAICGQYMNSDLCLNDGTVIKINNIQVVKARQPNVLDATTTVSGTATGTYGSTEQAMINALKTDVIALKTQLNSLMAVIREHGLMG